MFIKYNGFDLLELFCNEPKIIDEDAEIFRYELEDDFGFKLSMYISKYDQNVVLRLENQKYFNPIFDIDLKKVERIEKDGEKLSVYRSEIPKRMIVYFKPNFRLELDS